jgi:hypothetical protein
MKYQVGDTVLLLHSNEEGKVVEIIADKMLMVDVDGVVFPVYMDQVDFPYYKRFTEKKLFPFKKDKKYLDDIGKEKSSLIQRVEDGVWLSFLPIMEADEFGDEIVKELKLHLENHTNTNYNFSYRQKFFGKPDFGLNNQLHPFENFYLHDIAFEDMNDNPVFEFEFSLLQPDKKKAAFYETSLKLKPKQLFEKINKLKEKNEASFSYRLFETYPDKQEEEKFEVDSPSLKGYKAYDAKKARQHMEQPRSIIDLHIEKLSDDWKHLSNYEIMSIQLKTFEKYYELALAHIQPSLVVIHGVGEGRLRDEIHDRLRLKKEVKSFVNQYDSRFGYGATEIFFQY